MLYLSLLTLPRHHPRWQFLQPYDLHRLLMCALPDRQEKGEKPRLLYRHDERDTAHSVLVQTPVAPDWKALAGAADVKVKTFDPLHIEAGSQFRFLLRANPVVRRRGAYFKDGKARHVLVGSHSDWVEEQVGEELPSREEQLVDWLARKGQGERKNVPGGFTIVKHRGGEKPMYACVVSPPRSYSFRRESSKKPLHYVGVDFEGLLHVTNVDRFVQTLGGGIGRGKAFGFGLLSLAPVRG